jgi:hypothetical protein
VSSAVVDWCPDVGTASHRRMSNSDGSEPAVVVGAASDQSLSLYVGVVQSLGSAVAARYRHDPVSTVPSPIVGAVAVTASRRVGLRA